jgi:hypothetical protein
VKKLKDPRPRVATVNQQPSLSQWPSPLLPVNSQQQLLPPPPPPQKHLLAETAVVAKEEKHQNLKMELVQHLKLRIHQEEEQQQLHQEMQAMKVLPLQQRAVK